MKHLVLSFALVSICLTTSSIQAADQKVEPRAWLDSRGVLTLPELEKTLDTRFTGDERTKMEALLAQRNASILDFNARVNVMLRSKLAASDAQLAARVEKKTEDDKKAAKVEDDAAKEAAELERIRRRQPRRYQALMAEKRRQAEKEAQGKKDASPANLKSEPSP